MTPEERAKRIADLLNYRVYSETDKANFRAVVEEIAEAEREAVAEATGNHTDHFCFQEGWSAACKKAAGIVKIESRRLKRDKVNAFELITGYLDPLGELIEKMEPDK